MLALILAGGIGTRLNMGEKSMVTICGRPMISYVIDAFLEAQLEVVVVVTTRTPYTRNWCHVQGIDVVTSPGIGYIEDIIAAVCELEETKPLVTSVADIPCLQSTNIGTILSAYRNSGKDACSTWIPWYLRRSDKTGEGYLELIDGVRAYAVGINILHGGYIREPQDEFRFLVDDPNLAFNVNTREDLQAVQRILCTQKM